MVEATEKKEEEKQGADGQKNASERINLQHIMELREAFESADIDGGNSLDEDEFMLHFGDVIGKGMNKKQLRNLFMKIDADAGGTVEWHEFMNYMLLENQTLSNMKQEHFEYVKSEKPDPQSTKTYECHAKNITSILILYPEMYLDKGHAVHDVPGSSAYRKSIKYVTGSQDGMVKIWRGPALQWVADIKVSSYWVTCMAFMTASKRLAVATSDRMITFYDMANIKANQKTQRMASRIENLLGMPHCMEYVQWPELPGQSNKKRSENDKEGAPKHKVETLLMGDDLGFIHMYNMTDINWHYCFYKDYSKMEVRDPKFDKKPEEIQRLGAKRAGQATSHHKSSMQSTGPSTPKKGSRDGEEGEALEFTPHKSIFSSVAKKILQKKTVKTSTVKKMKPLTNDGCFELKLINDCHGPEAMKEFNKQWLKQFYEEKKTKDVARNVLEEKQIEMFSKKGKLTDQDVHDLKRAKDNFIAKSQPINPSKYQEHVRDVQVIHKQCHRSWITQIKYYPDIQNLVSSSLDGCIHIHDIGSLAYKEGRTFNLHQKGVNAFVYSPQHKVIASCGEERQIILWNPFTLMAQTYLPGHTTAVQDLALNEERNHLISLGTDKVVKIWHLHNYFCIQTITDKLCYRPDDVLTSLHFDKWTNNIVLGSRKVNFWVFKTQEEIKTSHEFSVAFALFNTEFESIVSGDDGGYIAVWDIENGKLMSRYKATSEAKPKLTSGCFDSTQRRMVTAAEGGYCRIWNFSNGQVLRTVERECTVGTEIKSTQQIDEEVTGLCCVFKPPAADEDPNDVKDAHFVAVGWDKRVRIWRDDRGEEGENNATKDIVRINRNRDWPQMDSKSTVAKESHKADIMTLCYDWQSQILFTGAHDGTIFGWHFETSSIKFRLHEKDDSCLSKTGGLLDSMKAIIESKSVDCLEIIQNRRVLMSGTADQKVRFWDLDDLPSKPLEILNVEHGTGEALTAFRATRDGKYLVTGDTAGQIKCWDLTKCDLKNDESPRANMRDQWFIMAHRRIINSIQLCESFPDSDIFVISSSGDCNIMLHRLSNGVRIGQLGQEKFWNIYDMSPYERVRPNYVRGWFNARREKFKVYVHQKLDEMKGEQAFIRNCEELEEESKARPPTKRYMTQREEKEEAEKRAKELHREKIKSLIKLDDHYEETVPFPDYSSDEEDPHADMKGVACSGYTYGAWKKAPRRRVTEEEVKRAEEKQRQTKTIADPHELMAESQAIRNRAKKIIDQNKDRSNKLF